MERINIEREKCAACLTCVVTCTDVHSQDAGASSISYNSRGYITTGADSVCTPVYCRCCNEPECVATCMSGALYKNPTNGHVMYDKERCGKCYMCVMSCPYGLPRLSNTPKPEIVRCNFCIGIADSPSCAAVCPTGAISVKEVG